MSINIVKKRNGEKLVDLTGATLSSSDGAKVLTGETAFGRDGNKITGTMTNRGAVSGTISSKAGTYIIQSGFHSGSETVQIASAEQNKIVADNIKSGVTILGVSGTCGGYHVVTGTYTGTTTKKSFTISGLNFKPTGVVVLALSTNNITSPKTTYMINATTHPIVASTGSNIYGTKYLESYAFQQLTGHIIRINSDGFTATRSSDFFTYRYLYVVWGE